MGRRIMDNFSTAVEKWLVAMIYSFVIADPNIFSINPYSEREGGDEDSFKYKPVGIELGAIPQIIRAFLFLVVRPS